MEHKIARRLLIALDALAALAAIGGGVMVVTGWPYQFPLNYLEPTPFTDYTVPGLILGIFVGGSALVATWEMFRNPAAGALVSFVASLIMMGWIIGEYIVIPAVRMTLNEPSSWQQTLYILIGLAMAALAVRVAPAAGGLYRASGGRGEARATRARSGGPTLRSSPGRRLPPLRPPRRIPTLGRNSPGR